MADDFERPQVIAQRRFAELRDELSARDLGARFSFIYEKNMWGSEESRSGLGSTQEETSILRTEIPALLREIGAKSLLDIPCGDFGWLSTIDLGVEYSGADIVPELIARNRKLYGDRFHNLDLTRDPLPQADIVLCRDCLVHLSFENIHRALANIARSGAQWLLTTTFTDLKQNVDIEDGDWRPLNFERPPFSFPPPTRVIIEGCIEADGAFADKALGLWSVKDLE